MQETIFEGDYTTRQQKIRTLLNTEENFDMLEREIVLGDRKAVFFYGGWLFEGRDYGKDHGVFLFADTGGCPG